MANFIRPTKRVGIHELPILPDRYDYTGQVTAEGVIVQVKHKATGHEMNLPAFGFVNEYDRSVAVLDSIMSCVAPDKLKEELAPLGKTINSRGAIIDLPPDQRSLRADANDTNPENGGNETD